jgi:hypothetical protein
LSIPDTNDVKEAFGSMIDTVAEQHDEIGKLNTNLDTSNQENKQSRRKLVDATNQKLQTLMQHNLELQKQLHYAQRKMRNFSYNVQGFLDPEDQEESSFSTIVDANSLKSVTITLQEVETQGLLFVTSLNPQLSFFSFHRHSPVSVPNRRRG